MGSLEAESGRRLLAPPGREKGHGRDGVLITDAGQEGPLGEGGEMDRQEISPKLTSTERGKESVRSSHVLVRAEVAR